MRASFALREGRKEAIVHGDERITDADLVHPVHKDLKGTASIEDAVEGHADLVGEGASLHHQIQQILHGRISGVRRTP
eukprot:2962550-Karenia_brevis.AAC.1